MLKLNYLLIFMFVNKTITSYGYVNKGKIYNSNYNYRLFSKKRDMTENSLSLLYKPKTFNQQKFVDCLNNKENYILAVIGPAGTGKTLLTCNSAIQRLQNNEIEKIIITRPVVPVEEDIGFLPGTLVKKMDPWTRPIFDIFEEYYSKSLINNMVMDGKIEISPLAYMRGRTFKNAFIIADEMQNSSPNQMYMLLTRVGISSNLVITGDLEQSDKSANNGLLDLINKIETNTKEKNIDLIKFGSEDVQRSKLVSQIMNLYNKNEVKNEVKNEISNINNNEVGGFNDSALIPLKDLKKK